MSELKVEPSDQTELETRQETALKGLTLRALVYGVLCTAFLCVAAVYVNIVMDGLLAGSATHVGVVAIFAVVVFAANMAMRGLANIFGRDSLLGRFFNALKLSGGELVVVYLMILVASAIPTLGLMENLIPTMGAPVHYADDTNAWSFKILPYVNPLMVPFDPDKLTNVASDIKSLEPKDIDWLYNGMPSDKTFWDIPWSIWLRPLAVWMIMIFAMYWVCFCLMAMLRRQWVERERLQFPLVQLPIAMVEGADVRQGIPAFFRNKVMWLGFAIPMMFQTWNTLAQFYPLLSTIPTSYYFQLFDKQMEFNIEPFNFPVIGFTYLVKTEVAFSLWAFCLVGLVVGSAFRYLGIQVGSNDMWTWQIHMHPWATHAAAGGVLMLGILTLWSARRSLSEVVRKAVGPAPDVDDRGEMLPYRLAWWGLWAGVIVMLLWMWQVAGMNPFWAAVFLVIAFLGLLAATRIIAEGGLVFVQFPVLLPSLMFRLFGQTTLGAANLVGLSWMGPWVGDIRVIMMPAIANSMKLADVASMRRRRLFWAFALAVVLSIVISGFMVLAIGYTKGGAKTQSWIFENVARDYFKNVAEANIPTPQQSADGIEPGERVFQSRRYATVVGAAIMVGLSVMRNRFLWWPFHPLGFPFAVVPGMQRIWLAIFMGWLFKVVILRYGGAALFRKLRPLFLGLILGEFLTDGVLYLVYFFIVTFFHGAGRLIYN